MRQRDLDSGDDLADVALCVFGGMEQEPEHGGGDPCPAHAAWLEKRRLPCRAQLQERGIDRSVERGKESLGRVPRHVRFALVGECLTLDLRERLAARVREKAVKAARRMP